MHETVNVARHLAKEFDFFFANFKDASRPNASSFKEHSDEWLSLTDVSIEHQLISDSMLYYYGFDENRSNTRGIYLLLTSASLVFLHGLACGHPMRGCLEVGQAGVFDEIGIYGPVLNDVKRYENSTAQYPRIVIGPELVTYLKSHSDKPDADFKSFVNRIEATTCLKLIKRDCDGNYILHYAQSEFLITISKRDGGAILDMFYSALKYSEYEYERFMKDGNDKLSLRYFLLLTYLKESKVHIDKQIRSKEQKM